MVLCGLSTRGGGEQEGTHVLESWPRATNEGGRMTDGE